MDFIKGVMQNEMVMSVLIMVIAWVGQKVISWIVNKWPVLAKLKLMEKWERVIDKVKEDKLAATAKEKSLNRHEINTLVEHYSKEEKVDPQDVKLHRRALKRNAVGLSIGYGKATGPTASVDFSRTF